MKGTRTRIDVGGVLVTGRELDIQQAVVLPDFASYRFPKPARAELRLRRVGRGLEIKGLLAAEAEGECARCLEPVSFPLQIAVAEQIDPPGEPPDPFAESNVLDDGALDLIDLARQLIDSALPLVLVCSSDCTGLCTTCGRKGDGTCGCTSTE